MWEQVNYIFSKNWSEKTTTNKHKLNFPSRLKQFINQMFLEQSSNSSSVLPTISNKIPMFFLFLLGWPILLFLTHTAPNRIILFQYSI